MIKTLDLFTNVFMTLSPHYNIKIVEGGINVEEKYRFFFKEEGSVIIIECENRDGSSSIAKTVNILNIENVTIEFLQNMMRQVTIVEEYFSIYSELGDIIQRCIPSIFHENNIHMELIESGVSFSINDKVKITFRFTRREFHLSVEKIKECNATTLSATVGYPYSLDKIENLLKSVF